MTKVEKFKEFLKSVGDEKGWDDSTLRKALRIAERRSRKSSHDDAAPGHMMIPILEWLRVWHDKDKDGNEFKRYGIAVGPPQEQPKREELEKEEKTIIGSDSNRDLRTTPRSGGNVFGQGELTDLKRPYAYGTGQGPRTDEDYPARRVKEYKPSNEEGWGCEEPPCEWGLLDAGAENMHMEDAGGLTTIHDQTEWERAHPDRWERSDTKSMELQDFTFYRQAYGRWRTKPDVLGERRIRQAYERRDPPDQLAIENDEEFRTLHQSGTKERFYGNNAPLPYEAGLTPGEELEDQSGLFPRPSWKQLPTCPDGRVENPAIRTCVGTEGARGGVTNIDEMHIESNSPHIGEGKSAWTRRCPDGRKFPLGSGTCGGRYGDSWDGVVDKNNEPGWPDYPDYAPVVGVDVRDEDEREKPIVGPAALDPRFRKSGVPGQHPSLPNQTLPNPTAPNRTEPNLTTGLGDIYYRRSQVKAKNNAAVRTSPYAWWKALERFGYGGDIQIGTKASTWKGPGKEPGRARFVQARTVSPTPRQSSPPQHQAQPATPTSSGQLEERAATQKQPKAPKPEALPAYLPWSGEPGPKQEETYAAQPPVQRQEGTPFTQFKPKVAREIPKTQNPPHVPAGLEVEEVERSRPISTEELQFVAEKVGKRPEEIDPKNLTFEEQVALGNLRATWRAGHAPFTPPPLHPEEVNELARFMGIKPSKINPKKLTNKQKDAYRQYFGEEPPGERPGSSSYEEKTYKTPQHREWMQPGDLQWLDWLTPAEYKLDEKGDIQLYKKQKVKIDTLDENGRPGKKEVERFLPTTGDDPDGEPMLVGGQEWVNEKFPDGEFTYNGQLALPQGLRYLQEGIDKKTGEKLTKEDIKKKQRNFRFTFEANKQMAWDRKEMVQENPGLLERYYQFGAQGLPSDREVKEYIKEKKRQEKERNRLVSGEVQYKMRTVYEGMVDRLLGSETGQAFPPQVRQILAASSTGALEVPQLDENASPEEVKRAMGLATVAQFGKNFVDMMFRKVRRAREKMIAQNPGSMASAKRRHTSGDQYELDQASSLATGYMWELLFQPLTEGETDLRTGKATGKPWTWEQLMERIGPVLYEWQRNPDGTIKRDPKTKKPIPEIASKKDVNPRYKGDKKRVEWLKTGAGNLILDNGEPIQVEVDTNQGTRTITGKKRQIQGKVINPKTGKEVIATYPNGDKKYKRVPFNWEYEIADNGEVVKIRERPVEEVLGHLFNLMGLSAAFEALDAEEFKGTSRKIGKPQSLDALAAKLEKSAGELAAQSEDEAQGRQREPGAEFAEEEETPNYETHPQAAVYAILNTFLKSTLGGSYGSRRNYLTNLWRQEDEARKKREQRTGKKEERSRDQPHTMIGPNVQMLPVVANAIFDRMIAKLGVMNKETLGAGTFSEKGSGGAAKARTAEAKQAILSTVNDDNERIREGEQPELPRDVRRFLLRLINGEVTNDRGKTVTLDTYSRKMGEFFLIMNILARKDVERDKNGKIITADQIAWAFANNSKHDGDLTKILGPYFEARGSTDETEIREAQTKRRLPPRVGPQRSESHDPTKEKMRERMEEARLRRMGGGKSLDWDEEEDDLDYDLDDQWGEICPDGSPMSPNTNTCAGREGWVPYTEDERRTETLSEPPKEGIGPKVRHPVGGKSYPAVPLSPFGRKGFKNRYQKGPDFFDQRLVG